MLINWFSLSGIFLIYLKWSSPPPSNGWLKLSMANPTTLRSTDRADGIFLVEVKYVLRYTLISSFNVFQFLLFFVTSQFLYCNQLVLALQLENIRYWKLEKNILYGIWIMYFLLFEKWLNGILRKLFAVCSLIFFLCWTNCLLFFSFQLGFLSN